MPADYSGIVFLTPEELEAATPQERARYGAYLRRELHRVDPVRWGRDLLQEHWWSKQREIAMSVARNKRTAVRSCHESGKSFIAARVAAWWLSTGLDRFVISTAPTGDQVKAILWKEIGRAHKKGKLPGRTNLTEWYIDGEIVGIGRKPADHEPTAFNGQHASDGVLVIYDEACGIPEGLFIAGASMAGNDESRELAIGNPDDPSSHFSTLFRPDTTWNTIGISCFDTPRFTGEDVPELVLRSLVSPGYESDMARDHGKSSAFYISKCLGQFPKDRSDGMIPNSWLQKCRYLDTEPDGGDIVSLGVDVGGSAAGDETVVRVRRGMVAGERFGWRYDDPMQSVGDILQIIKDTGATSVKIDATGVGHGVWGRLREVCEEQGINVVIHAVMVGSAAEGTYTDKDGIEKKKSTLYKNLKAQIWWEVGRELSREQAWDLTTLDDKTIEELAEHKYFKDSSMRIVVESKDDVKKRLKRSPDDADAVLLAFHEPLDDAPEFLGAA